MSGKSARKSPTSGARCATPKSAATETRRRPDGVGLHRGDDGVGLARVGQHAAGAVVVDEADLGRADAARGAVEKPRAEPRLERRDVLGYGRFRDPELARGIREAALVDDRGEGLHLAQTIHTA